VVPLTVSGSNADGNNKVMRLCQKEEPDLREVMPSHWAACHFVENYSKAPVTVPQLDHRRQVVPDVVEGATALAAGGASAAAVVSGVASPHLDNQEVPR